MALRAFILHPLPLTAAKLRLILPVMDDLIQRLAAEGVRVDRGLQSPLAGRKGNREFLFLLRLAGATPSVDTDGLAAALNL